MDRKLLYVKTNILHAHGAFEDDPEDGFMATDFNGMRKDDVFIRRLCAAWNYCEGVPTEELESRGKDAGFWGRACARVEGERDELKEENAALRAENERLKQQINDLGNQP